MPEIEYHIDRGVAVRWSLLRRRRHSGFGTPASIADPTLPRLIDLVESSAKPVVAAIAGTSGQRPDLAIAAHYRVASRDAKLGLPEVKLGLIPGVHPIS